MKQFPRSNFLDEFTTPVGSKTLQLSDVPVPCQERRHRRRSGSIHSPPPSPPRPVGPSAHRRSCTQQHTSASVLYNLPSALTTLNSTTLLQPTSQQQLSGSVPVSSFLRRHCSSNYQTYASEKKTLLLSPQPNPIQRIEHVLTFGPRARRAAQKMYTREHTHKTHTKHTRNTQDTHAHTHRHKHRRTHKTRLAGD